MSEWVHLNCHSEFSIIDGILKLKPFVAKVKELGMNAVAMTDHSNLFGMIKFYKAALNAGIKPIIGCDLWLDLSSEFYRNSRLTVLCQNELGLKNLMILVSRSYNNWKDRPLVDLAWLVTEKLSQGLIAIAPMFDSDIGKALLHKDFVGAANFAATWQSLFEDRFYLGLSRLGQPDEAEQIYQILQIAKNTIPVVASNEVRFLNSEDFLAHEVRICINQRIKLNDPQRKKTYTKLQYLRTPHEMLTAFADLPAAIINAQEIAKRCNVTLSLGKTYLPKYITTDGTTEQDHLKNLAMRGLLQRLNCTNSAEIPLPYLNRINNELAVIIKMGFEGYFLIVADIIQWSLQQGIPVGPGRGSGAGSLTAYALFITNLDPLPYGLLFERFLNPERISMPDFDIDFCIKGRDLVIDYVAAKYGQTAVAQIITYGTMAAKAAIRDVGRALGSPYLFVDQIAKLIPLELGITLNKALDQESSLKAKYEEDEEVKSIIDLAIKLEGIVRNVSKHAGGLVIAPAPIVNFCPLYCESNDSFPVTQFDKNDIEDLGLIKFDFLGLKTLTIIDLALKAINKPDHVAKLDLNKLPLNDLSTFNLLSEGNTIAIFQLESRGMRELTIKLQANCFEDLIAIGALYRPGPLQSGMVDDFIKRKRGKEIIKYPHPELIDILKPTYGVIVYQEQVMQIAQILAGYTLGSADLLRRAMGKKKPEEMAKQRKIFLVGAKNLDQDRAENLKLGHDNADQIFDLMDKFSGYGFNKSHAAAYALITYQTAWLKAHYPAEFMAAVLSLDLGNTDKIITFIINCRNMGIEILPPEINRDEYYFIAKSNRSISYGLGAIKGVGESALTNITTARQAGPFNDLLDLCLRVDLHKVSRKTLEALIKAGALDCFKLHRAALLHYVEEAMKIAHKLQQRSVKQLDLFGANYEVVEQSIKQEMQFKEDICPKWDRAKILLEEKQALGFYFSDHPLAAFTSKLAQLEICKFTQAKPMNKNQKFAGSIVAIKLTRNKRGEKMAYVTLDDADTYQEVLILPELYLQHKELLKKEQLIIIQGETAADSHARGIRIKCHKIWDLNSEIIKLAKNLIIVLSEEITDFKLFTPKIKDLLTAYPGTCPIIIHYRNNDLVTKIKLGERWTIRPEKSLILQLTEISEVVTAYIEW